MLWKAALFKSIDRSFLSYSLHSHLWNPDVNSGRSCAARPAGGRRGIFTFRYNYFADLEHWIFRRFRHVDWRNNFWLVWILFVMKRHHKILSKKLKIGLTCWLSLNANSSGRRRRRWWCDARGCLFFTFGPHRSAPLDKWHFQSYYWKMSARIKAVDRQCQVDNVEKRHFSLCKFCHYN